MMKQQPVSVRNLFGFPIVRGIGRDYTIPQVDLSAELEDIQPLITVDGSRPYLGHPDSILCKTGEILTFFPAGHGRGAVLGRVSARGKRPQSTAWSLRTRNSRIS